jgi:hypothetical protein
MIYLQNKVTGEIKDVEPDSQEFRDLIAARTPDNKPVWEQQSDTAVAARVERAEAGELRDTDLPKDHPVLPERNVVTEFAPEREPWKNLTDAEVELGLTPEQKCEHEQAIADTSAQRANAQTRAAAADAIASSDTQRRGGQGVTTQVPSGAAEPEPDGGTPDGDDQSKGDE